MLHSIMGLRTNNAELFFRFVIARTSLSTLEPGKNDAEVDLRETLLERMNSLRHL